MYCWTWALRSQNHLLTVSTMLAARFLQTPVVKSTCWEHLHCISINWTHVLFGNIGFPQHILQRQMDFQRLEKVEIGGRTGKTISLDVAALYAKFTDESQAFASKQFDPLDLTSQVRHYGYTDPQKRSPSAVLPLVISRYFGQSARTRNTSIKFHQNLCSVVAF